MLLLLLARQAKHRWQLRQRLGNQLVRVLDADGVPLALAHVELGPAHDEAVA